jgi:8-oxo-dGTP diphosphatase
MDKKYVRVGIGVLVFKGDKILLGRRIASHNKDTWQSTGGHLEFGESFEECAKREVLEETGLHIKNIRQIITTNDIFHKDNKHYVTIFMASEYESGSPLPLEPDKCAEWKWFDRNNLPDNLFLPYNKIISLIE